MEEHDLLQRYPAYTKEADGSITPHHVVKRETTTVPAPYSRLNRFLNRNFGTNYQTEREQTKTTLSNDSTVTITTINHQYENWN